MLSLRDFSNTCRALWQLPICAPVAHNLALGLESSGLAAGLWTGEDPAGRVLVLVLVLVLGGRRLVGFELLSLRLRS